MKIAVWYHCLITGPRIPSEDNAIGILSEQMADLKASALAEQADEIHIGVNGPDHDLLTVSCFVPDRSILHANHDGQSELATMALLQRWLKPGWAVLYHHIKGVQHAPNAGFHNWRRNMQRVCVLGWRECVMALENGYDTAGAHWFTPERGALPGQRYWPGNFWWSKSEHLMTLPKLPEDKYERRYDAEDWVGKSPRYPRFKDFWKHMPLG